MLINFSKDSGVMVKILKQDGHQQFISVLNTMDSC